MAIRAIRIWGDPVLHERAAEVPEITDEIRSLVLDMFDTMDLAPGVGLAAPQVGVGLRIFVYSYEYLGEELRGVAINPELELSETPPEDPDPELESEGCLSLPEERFPLKRANSAVLTAMDLDGQSYRLEVEGWMARIFQHEFDHLNGTLYADRLLPKYREELEEVIQESGWGVPGISWLPGVDDLEP
jgi:peptide deformylase